MLPRLGGIVIDARVMLFCLGLSLVSTLLIGLVPALRVSRAAFGEGLALHAGGSAHDGRPSGRAAADAAGRRADCDDARPPDRRGPADSQLRASHVGVDRLRIERARRRRADRESDAAPTLRRRARTHACVRARRARSHPVPAGRDVREPDQLDAVREDVHSGQLRDRGSADVDAQCRQAEDRVGLFQDHEDSAAGGTRVHLTGHGGSAESGDHQRAHRARIPPSPRLRRTRLSRWSGRGARPTGTPGRSRRVADGGGRGRGHPSEGTRSASDADDLRALPAGTRRSVPAAVRGVRRAHAHTRQRARRHPGGNSPRRARFADPKHGDDGRSGGGVGGAAAFPDAAGGAVRDDRDADRDVRPLWIDGVRA